MYGMLPVLISYLRREKEKRVHRAWKDQIERWYKYCVTRCKMAIENKEK